MNETIRIDIQRTNKGTHVEGSLHVIDLWEIIFKCFTLELPWKGNEKYVSCIPDGTYRAKRYYSTKYNHECLMLENVPNRSAIAIHPGNYTRQIEGCILPGDKLIDIDGDGLRDVTNSRDTLKELLQNLPDEKIEVNVNTMHGKRCVLDCHAIK